MLSQSQLLCIRGPRCSNSMDNYSSRCCRCAVRVYDLGFWGEEWIMSDHVLFNLLDGFILTSSSLGGVWWDRWENCFIDGRMGQTTATCHRSDQSWSCTTTRIGGGETLSFPISATAPWWKFVWNILIEQSTVHLYFKLGTHLSPGLISNPRSCFLKAL